MPLNVCVECGTRVRRLIRKLQYDNYCLEKCVSLISIHNEFYFLLCVYLYFTLFIA